LLLSLHRFTFERNSGRQLGFQNPKTDRWHFSVEMQKVKETLKTLKVRTGRADLRLKALQPKSAMGDEGQPSC